MNAELIKIFVLTHTLDKLPSCYSHPLYASIQCGTSKDNVLSTDFHDNDGEFSIAQYNEQMNEMTGIYWLYHNLESMPDLQFIGLAQYRRHLDLSNIKSISANEILCGSMKFNMSAITQYAECHPMFPFALFIDSLMQYDQQLATTIVEILSRCQFFYRANLAIMHRKMFMRYGHFIDVCIQALMKLEKMNIEKMMPTSYQRRWMGFILERMTSCFIVMAQQQQVKIVDLPIIDIDMPNTKNGTR